MQEFVTAFAEAFHLIAAGDSDLLEIVGLSLRVSLTAVVISCVIGFPLGAVIGIGDFRGRQCIIVCVNALMGLPPVVVGLVAYLILSNSGPLGWLDLLYSPTAMMVAQTILVVPIVTALSRQIVEDFHAEYAELFRSLSVPHRTAVTTLLMDAKHSLATVALAGFGRAIAEVGAVIIVGGNIDHLTRVMTTAIALETSKGNLALALALGMILIVLSLAVNATVSLLREASGRPPDA